MSSSSAALAAQVDAVHLTRDARTILRGVSFDVPAGSVNVLVGASGSGKSTILRTLVALEPFHQGRITLGSCSMVPGPVPAESRLRALRRYVGMVFQQHALFSHLTVRDNVMLAPMHTLGATPQHAARLADELLTSLGVIHRADAFPAQISGGEAQRVAIARALALDPPLLLMDEPTAALDPARRGALADALRTLADQGRALLITTHDVEFARAVGDTALVLDGGIISDRGAPDAVLSRYLERRVA